MVESGAFEVLYDCHVQFGAFKASTHELDINDFRRQLLGGRIEGDPRHLQRGFSLLFREQMRNEIPDFEDRYNRVADILDMPHLISHCLKYYDLSKADDLTKYAIMQLQLDDYLMFSYYGDIDSVGFDPYRFAERRAIEEFGGEEKFINFLQASRKIPDDIDYFIHETFIQEKIKIMPDEFFNNREALFPSNYYAIIIPNGTIIINSKLDREERLKSLMHEIMHLHPRYFDYTLACWYFREPRACSGFPREYYDKKLEKLMTRRRDHDYSILEAEARIEADVRRIIQERPQLVDSLGKACGF